MKTKFTVLFLSLILTGCAGTKYVAATKSPKLVAPPSALVACGKLQPLPPGDVSRDQLLLAVGGWATTNDDCANKQKILSNLIEKYNSM